MAHVVVTIRVTPESPDVNLNILESNIRKEILRFIHKEEENFVKCEVKPFAFGLHTMDFMFAMDEALGSTDALEDILRNTEEVQGVEVTDVRRMLG